MLDSAMWRPATASPGQSSQSSQSRRSTRSGKFRLRIGWLATLVRRQRNSGALAHSDRQNSDASTFAHNAYDAADDAYQPPAPVPPANSPHAQVDDLYARHARSLLGYLYHRLPALADAEDVLAKVFLLPLSSAPSPAGWPREWARHRAR